MNIIKRIREENHLSQAKFAEILNVHQTAVSQWENGRTFPDISSAKLISQKFGISLDVLLSGNYINNTEPFSYNISGLIKIPVLGNIPAGVPIEAIEEILGHIDIPESMAAGGKEFFALKIKGDSMSPKYENGDVVLFEHCSSCDSGSDCAVMVNGDDVTFKRVEIVESGIMLKPMNPNYETMFYTKKDIEDKPVRIIGIARQVRRDV